jgi:hypothetical protein
MTFWIAVNVLNFGKTIWNKYKACVIKKKNWISLKFFFFSLVLTLSYLPHFILVYAEHRTLANRKKATLHKQDQRLRHKKCDCKML